MTADTTMKSPMLRALIGIFCFVPSFAAAGTSSYFCETSKVYELAPTGALREDKLMTSHLREKPFSVERESGRIVSDFHANTAPRVLWNPRDGDGNDYQVIDFGVSERTAFASVLIIREWVESSSKPFIWHWGSQVITGVCK